MSPHIADVGGIHTMTDEFERLVQEFEKFERKIKSFEQQAVDAAEMTAEIEALQATVTSPDGAVTVVAGPAGAIKDIRFTNEALDRGASALSGTVLSTLHRAVAEAARQQALIIERHAGGDLHIVDQVLEAQAQAFGTTVEELRERVDLDRPSQHPAPSNSAGNDFLRNIGGEEDY